MPNLDLQKSVLSSEAYHLFSADGVSIPLADENMWTHFGDIDNPWIKTSVELPPGNYWMIFVTANYASLHVLEVDESTVEKSEETSWDTGQFSVPIKTPVTVFTLLREYVLSRQLS